MARKLAAYGSADHWYNVLHDEFNKESDRAAVILTASLFDNALYQLLRVTLIAAPSSSDELLDGASAPISTFSARINLAYRIGLISKSFCRDLHLVRSIRNRFAHNVSGCSFEEGSVRSQVLELARSSGAIERSPKTRGTFPNGPRGDFLFTSSWMLWSLNYVIESTTPFDEAQLEMGYHPSAQDDENKTEAKQATAGGEKNA